jgi:hypothetical protein
MATRLSLIKEKGGERGTKRNDRKRKGIKKPPEEA